MNETWIVFLAGMGGVFCGMTFLYIAIRIISTAAARIAKKQTPDNEAAG